MQKLERLQNIVINRGIIIALVVVSLAQYFWTPTGALWILDVLFRAYLLFLCGVMGHEASHGVLGDTKLQNIWWGRISFIPIAVPNAQFRITHRYHHSFTNEDGKDPDLLLKMDHWWQFPGRALAMPHHWIMWLKNNSLLSQSVILEILLSYVVYFAIFGTISYFVGWERVLLGLVPAQILNSFLLWYPFAVKTHEGHEVGPQEVRSHDYHGALMYWFTLGLSMHRAHHMRPHLGWLQLRPYIKKGPVFKRDIIRL
ncbi:fatty acid desaturase family protein [Peredibacter starrii]|uniref:Fatty acid desaturase n=1 Tax=Peredibacter starrii TaxID=28202 RepID=A0AAX4HUG8_9BACT|nr:fatty acid desaturase [Peredibacter starrii]WPU66944.1 fatty acid desaturase [Peredibacter starrii]